LEKIYLKKQSESHYCPSMGGGGGQEMGEGVGWLEPLSTFLSVST